MPISSTGSIGLLSRSSIDAVAVGQFTPGPVFTTATFIGYVVAGVPGAVIATIGMFLPSFLLVAVSGPLIPRLRRSRIAGAFLAGVNVAALALMVDVSVQLGKAAIFDVPTTLLAVVSGAALLRWRVNSAWLVLSEPWSMELDEGQRPLRTRPPTPRPREGDRKSNHSPALPCRSGTT